MKSPFPGMDPYIESAGLWEDFHNHLVEKIGERLADAAPDRYLVRTGERSYVVLVESEAKKSYAFLPAVSVTTTRRRRKTAKRTATAVAEPDGETEPVTMRPFIQAEQREAFVEIYEAGPDRRLVTCVDSSQEPALPCLAGTLSAAVAIDLRTARESRSRHLG
jgi:hypothetical protein